MKKIALISLLLSITLLNSCSSLEEGNSPDYDDLPEVDPATVEGHTLGDPDAPFLIQEFADFQCPGCAQTSPLVKAFVLDNPELVRMEFYHFPLTSIHQYAFAAAEASECAADQDMFWEYEEMLFENQSQINEDYLYNIADSLQLDREAFDQCLEEGEKKEKVESHMALGVQMEVNGTPSLFLDGEYIVWPGANQFKAYLESL